MGCVDFERIVVDLFVGFDVAIDGVYAEVGQLALTREVRIERVDDVVSGELGSIAPVDPLVQGDLELGVLSVKHLGQVSRQFGVRIARGRIHFPQIAPGQLAEAAPDRVAA